MNIQFLEGKVECHKGVQINLTGDEVARAIYTYLTAHNVNIVGAATIMVNGELCKEGQIYVDPSGRVVADGVGFDGSENKEIPERPYVEDLLDSHIKKNGKKN
jgi:hypothetical protein